MEESKDNNSVPTDTSTDAIFEATEWMRDDDVNRRRTDSGRCQSAQDLEQQMRIFGVQLDEHGYYAAYQFNRELDPLDVIREILRRLKQADPWAIAAWFHFPNGWPSLGHKGDGVDAPKNSLDRPADVIRAAEN